MDGSTELPLCDSEPIHIPGSIQPHGMMLVAARDGLLIWQVAGEVERWLGVEDWQGAPMGSLIGPELTQRVAALAGGERRPGVSGAYIGQVRNAQGVQMDVSAHLAELAGAPGSAPGMVVVELEPASSVSLSAAALLDGLDEASASFQRAGSMAELCAAAAAAFRGLIGFDRVMIYRFGENDGAGCVLAEDKRGDLRSFMNHHFPASDIPRQARALYVRNLVRVIPDIHYTPAPLRPPAPGSPLDLSDSSLRSVSPVHLQYLFNMGVRGSASFSILKDGALWGLVACHNEAPRRIPYEVRVACRTLAAALSREIKGKDESEGYRERLRLRSFEDDVVRLLSREASLDVALSKHVGEVQRAMSADGVAVLRGGELVTGGVCPPRRALRALAGAVLQPGAEPVRATDRLSEVHPPAAAYADVGSGLLALVLSVEEPWLVMWFRAEQMQTVRWAGNPHTAQDRGTEEQLTPRASFDDWVEEVRGRARNWTAPEIEAAGRLRTALLEVRQNRRLAELNRQLTQILRDKDMLLQQKEFLVGEVNHRVQNSLQLVHSFLASQARDAGDGRLRAALDEACRRLTAVGLVHRRLYRGDQIQQIDAARYIEELCLETLTAMGPDWRKLVSLDLAPCSVSTDRAVTLGLVLTELMINATKYAYGGQAGPLGIQLREQRPGFAGRGTLQLVVADRGVGRGAAPQGFGSRMVEVLVRQLGGAVEYQDNAPGVRAVLTISQDASVAAIAQ